MGNDYPHFAIENQMALMYSLKMGTFPLYVPGYAGGSSASALTLGQIFHPLPHLASLAPGYWQGNALEIMTLLRLLSLGLVHLLLFGLLIRLKLADPSASFLISMGAVYNFRMLDLFRYGASLEGHTAQLLLCISLCHFGLKETKVLGPLSIIFSSYLLLVSGHPQNAYLGMLGALATALIVPYYVDLMMGKERPLWPLPLGFYGKVGLFLSIGALLSSCYLLPFIFEFLRENAGRVHQSFLWAAYPDHTDPLLTSFNTFFSPLESNIHGSCGGPVLLVMALLFPLSAWGKGRTSRTALLLWALAALIFLTSLGVHTPLYHYFWKHVPFAQNFRIPGRLTISIPFLLSLLLAHIFQHPQKFLPLSLISILAYSIYPLLPLAGLNQGIIFSPASLFAIGGEDRRALFTMGLLALAFTALYLGRERLRKFLGPTLIAVNVLHLSFALANGSWSENKAPTPTWEEITSAKKKDMSYGYDPGFGMTSVLLTDYYAKMIRAFPGELPALSKLRFPLARIIPSFALARSEEEVPWLLKNLRRRDVAVLQAPANGSLTMPMGANRGHLRGRSPHDLRLGFNSYNRLDFNIAGDRAGIFVLGFPYHEGWRAYLNGQRVDTFKANGINIGVAIPEGKNQLEFRYWSWASVTGMAISLITLLAIFIYFSSGPKARYAHWTAATLGVLFFFNWLSGLYGGKDIGTEYAWTHQGPSAASVNRTGGPPHGTI